MKQHQSKTRAHLFRGIKLFENYLQFNTKSIDNYLLCKWWDHLTKPRLSPYSSTPPAILHSSSLAVPWLPAADHPVFTPMIFSPLDAHPVLVPLLLSPRTAIKRQLPHLPQSCRFSPSELTLPLFSGLIIPPPLLLCVLVEYVSASPTTVWDFRGQEPHFIQLSTLLSTQHTYSLCLAQWKLSVVPFGSLSKPISPFW